ncbi:two-component system response regulator [Vibrio sp. D404a]|uniref:HD-GYP domain-containing protein n=1 Tax=unclassified Vibrio TaxID=2614977 RepID=UPI002557662A|nr:MULTISPECIES: two-component system response regulator [unclassified Vibrio]MDK9738516.1 two-component system response regulator [Vibrio sp. D404a]MDK9796120.1 two-component system response regulator [Vibrio sp. D449a]
MSSKPTVLVVDDTPSNLDVLTGILKDTYQVKVAINGHVGLKIAKTMPQPDLILLDIMMPDIDGFEVCRQLKSQPNTAHIPIIFVTAKIDPEDEVKGLSLGAVDYITKPITPEIARQRVKTHIALYDQKRVLDEQVQEKTEEIKLGLLETIKILGRAAEFKDNETGMHVLRMSHYCYVLAVAAGMPKEDAETFRDAAPMHDIGKIGIPDAILLKPGKLNDQEWNVMRQHVEFGIEILGNHSDSKLMKMAVEVAQYHHEKWDGTGYPNQLSGDDIPLVGRIAAVADVFDALTADRPYKKAWSIEETLALFEREKGKHFDPMVVDLLIQNLDQILSVKEQFKDE